MRKRIVIAVMVIAGFGVGAVLGSVLITDEPPADGSLEGWLGLASFGGLVIGFALGRRRNGPPQIARVAAGLLLSSVGAAVVVLAAVPPLPHLGLLLVLGGFALAGASAWRSRTFAGPGSTTRSGGTAAE